MRYVIAVIIAVTGVVVPLQEHQVNAPTTVKDVPKRQLALYSKQLPEPPPAPKQITVTATYYVAMCTEGCTGITATGLDVRNTIHTPAGKRIIAVDPAVIPLGTEVSVSTPYSTFTAVAGDTGGAINGYKIDILVSNRKEAREKGKVKAVITWN